MNLEQVTAFTEWFAAYVQTFAGENANMHSLLQLKIDHSRRVAEEARCLAEDIGWDASDTNAAKALGLLHDVGRFPQFAEYGTFSDAVSVDHGRYGQAVMAGTQVVGCLTPVERDCLLDGIRHHNARYIPEGLAPDSVRFLRLVRDADKLDILQVVMDAVETNGFCDLARMLPHVVLDRSCSARVVEDIQNHRCCSLKDVRSLGDFLVMQLSWVFDLNYESTFRQWSSRGIVSRMLRLLPENSVAERMDAIVQAFVANKLNS